MAANESEDVADKATKSLGAKLFLCPVDGCPLKFSRALHLEQHAASHTRDKRFVCDDCGKVFFHEANLRDHLRYHADLSRDLPCPECGAVLKGKRALANHVASRHNTVECPDCGLKMARAALRRHAAKEHRTEAGKEKSYECESCQRSFSAMRSLMLHRRTHEDSGRASGRIRAAAFPCRRCKRAFDTAEDLQKHAVSAHEETQCPDCGKTTKNLARHTAYVHSTRYAAKLVRTECPHPGCGKAYASVYAAKYHFEKCHGSGRVPSKACCGVCGKHVTSLSRHTREVHEENRFECAECGNFFPVRASLERHVRTVHNGERLACPYCEVEVVHLENHLAIVHAMLRSDAKQIVEQRTGKASARTDLQWTAFAE